MPTSPHTSCACLCNNSKCGLPSFVSSFCCKGLLHWCFLPNKTACMILQHLSYHVLVYTMTTNVACLHLLVPSVAQGCFISASCMHMILQYLSYHALVYTMTANVACLQRQCFLLNITACMILQYLLLSCTSLCNNSKCHLPSFVSLSFLVLLMCTTASITWAWAYFLRENSFKKRGWGYFRV